MSRTNTTRNRAGALEAEHLQTLELIELLRSALREINPRWTKQCALWLDEHVTPHHPDLPLLASLAGHLRHVAKVTEDALVEADNRIGRVRESAKKYPGPHIDLFQRDP